MQHLKAGRVIGKNIRRVRMEQGFTQKEFATQLQLAGLDLSRSTIAKIESGIRHITLDELKAIKVVLKMEYGDFFDD